MSVVIPQENDVLFGRGFTIAIHPGNRHLRQVVESQRPTFLTARKKEKRQIARRIVASIKDRDPPGRFLMEDPNSPNTGNTDKEPITDRVWILVDKTEKAVDKVMHRLRERVKPSASVDTAPQLQQPGMVSTNRGIDLNSVLLPQQQPSNDLTTYLQNMQQSIDNNFLGMGIDQQIGQPLQQSYNPMRSNGQGSEGQQQQYQATAATVVLPHALQHQQQQQQQHIQQLQNQQWMQNQQLENQQLVGQLGGQSMQSLIGQQQNQEQNRFQQMVGPQSNSGDDMFGFQQPALSISSLNSPNQQMQQHVNQQQPVVGAHSNYVGNAHQSSSALLHASASASPETGMGQQQGSEVMMNAQLYPMQPGPQSNDFGNGLGSQTAGSMLLSGLNSFGSQQAGSSVLSGLNSNLPPQPQSRSSSVGSTHSASMGSPGMNQSPQPLNHPGSGSPMLQSIHEQGSSNIQPPTISMTTPLYQEVQINTANQACNPMQANDDIDREMQAVENDDFEAFIGFLDDLPPNNIHALQQHQKQLTLREWIERSKPCQGRLAAEMDSYVKAAIPLALKLTEVLLEAENGAHSIPLASIKCENVLVECGEGSDVVVDRVMIKTEEDGTNLGENTLRLFALGVILYEIFSHVPLNEEDLNATTRRSHSKSVRGLSLADETDRQSKRPQLSSSFSRINDIQGDSMARLELFGVPHSVCALVRNLLDQGDFCGDDAYRSLSDVRTDIQLMLNDPSCFLDNLRVGPHPSFEIRSKFYGREDDIARIQQSYQQHMNGGCGGILVSGGAGVGKSSLVSQAMKTLSLQTNSRFLEAKFEQSVSVNPLATIGAVFNSLCDAFAQEATPSQLNAVALALETALGNQTALLGAVLPSLSKLIDCSNGGASSECIDPAASMQFLFRKLLEVISQHKRIALFLDDLQWADPASLLLIASILSNARESSFVFFACCYRDDNINERNPFTVWLSSITVFPLEKIELRNIAAEGANELVSETLHLSPRLTRPLSSILHHKTRGNPLFLRQLLESLREQGHIHLNLNPPRWAWDLNKIANLELSDDVVSLLMKEMRGLSDDLQLGLRVASCLGFCVNYSTLDILSKDLGVDLRDLLDQMVQKGLMVRVDDDKIRFAHDKIQQAAYEMMSTQQQLESHMRFGLAICSHTLGDRSGNDELFFVAVNQMNRGGADSLPDPQQRVMVAALNLKAGKRSIELSDFSTALKLFEHGISFLSDDWRWTSQYNLSLKLFDSAVEMACALNETLAVRSLSEQVVAHSRCPDDELKCLYAVAKSLRLAFKFEDSKKVAYTILEQLNERMPRSSDDAGVATNIQNVKLALQSMSDESILGLNETNQKERDILLLNVYHDLNFLFQFIDTTRIADCSLRMAEITLSNGLCCMSPLALAQMAIVLVNSAGEPKLAYRVSTLALRLLDKMNAQQYTSAVIALVGTLVSWVAEPLQSIAETHFVGYNHGQQNGDAVASGLNYLFYLQIDYQSGQSLPVARDKSREFTHELLRRKKKFMLNGSLCIYLQAVAFIEGLDFKAEEDGLESWEQIAARARIGSHQDFSLVFATHQYTRSFLFKQYDQLPQFNVLNTITQKKVPLRPIFYYGVFFEGLTSIHFARQTDANEYHRKVEAALVFMRKWSKINRWNFENKYKLLEAEMMHLSGYHDQATQLYEESVRLANEHKFLHEEAIASELAAAFFYERGLVQKSQAFFGHSVDCYKKWGALAVAARVENDFRGKFNADTTSCGPMDDAFLASLLRSKEDSSRKRIQRLTMP